MREIMMKRGGSPHPGPLPCHGRGWLPCYARRGWQTAILAAVLACATGTANAQSVESDVPPDAADLVKDASAFHIPDISDSTLKSANVTDERDRFSVKFGLVLLPADYTTFDQDSESRQQVGNQHDEFEARS